jgi:hypothetical protein
MNRAAGLIAGRIRARPTRVTREIRKGGVEFSSRRASTLLDAATAKNK